MKYIADYLNHKKLPELPTGNFIGGRYVQPIKGGRFDSYDPGLGVVFAQFANSTSEDVDMAVHSAERALQTWRKTSLAERRTILNRAGELLRQNVELYAFIEALDAGKTYNQAVGDVTSSARIFEYYASVADTIQADAIPLGQDYCNMMVKEPVGVVAQIIPWNYPLNTMVRGIAPALAAGCTIVAKPAETTPFTALLLGQLLVDAGLPAGVLNVIAGTGVSAGAPLVAHKKIRHITFTGSVATGVMVSQSAAQNVTRLTLELGGKSPFIVCDDANIDKAVEDCIWAIFENAGQICSAGSRLIINKRVKDEFLGKLIKRAETLSVGHGLKHRDVGAINNSVQLKKISEFVELAKKRGLSVILGGKAGADDTADSGYFYRPTIIDNVPASDPCVCEEIFGPVLSVQAFDTDEEVIELANGTNFGLMCGIYTSNIHRALRFARDIESGQVTINEYWAGGIAIPFGGVKYSGYGREKGLEAIGAYTSLKAVTFRI